MFTKVKTLALLFLVVSFDVSFSFANQRDAKGFFDRFEVQTNSKGHKIIVDKTILNEGMLRDYILNIADYLKADEYSFTKLREDMCAGADYRGTNTDINKSVDKVLEWMKKSNLGVIIADEKFIRFIEAVDVLAQKFKNDPDYVVMANMDSANYFYKRSIFKFLKSKLLDLAKSSFDSTPYLSLVKFIVEDYSNQIALKKLYRSNVLSYYLETFSADELGLTESQRTKALSSLYDSRLSFGLSGYISSKKIISNFEGFGLKQIEKVDKEAEKRFSSFEELFDKRISKINSSYSELSFASMPMYFDLSNKQSVTDKRPSLSFDAKCPELMFELRRRFELVRFGVDVLPIPYADKLFSPFKKSYRAQSLNEGKLYAYLESTHQDATKAYILKQSMNPLMK